ncbi:MAG TPA: MBOAT family protein [Caulobacteraceae bacterium]|jgi:D-alanyl-lipoteichoic acid acyltransferase DltB (MBOAT superfamily)|nr:MBOAT family protein [Caulobacteraceae bacterium]
MLFPTMMFLFFFLVVYIAAWSLERQNANRKAFLVLASWIFYGAWDWRFVGLLFLSAVFNWYIARSIVKTQRRSARKWLIALDVFVNLGVFAVFKYYNFFTDQLGVALQYMHWERDLPLINMVLPVGISFFTFQAISYVVDVHRGKVPPAKSLLDVMLMMSFFPHLVAGPIVRASDLLPQFAQTPKLNRGMATHALLLIAWGLFKKTVIASELASGLVDKVFFDPSSHGAIDLLAGVYGYAVQIYCDFSAYTDIAIGLAALLGYRFPRNFDQPYRATSLQEFWRRWHISLSSWLRDYLFIPLGGSRGGLLSTCRNIMVTMLLGGLWHGASWTFVAWGGLHGGVLSVERIWKSVKPAHWPKWPAIVGLLITFHVVCLSWILFRSESFDLALAYLKGFGNWSTPAMELTPFLGLLIVFGLGMHFLPPRAVESVTAMFRNLPSPAFAVGLAVVLLLVDAMRPEGIAPFIYYQF